MTEWLVAALLIVGTAFMLTSSIGLVRLPDFYTRMHGPTKAATLGVICVLAACVLYFTFEREFFNIREIVALLFLFATAPVGAHLRAQGVTLHLGDGLAGFAGSGVLHLRQGHSRPCPAQPGPRLVRSQLSSLAGVG